MFYLEHCKIQLNFSFGFRLFQIARKDIRYNLSASFQQGFSFHIVCGIGLAFQGGQNFLPPPFSLHL